MLVNKKNSQFKTLHDYFDYVAETLGYPQFHKYFKTEEIISDGLKIHLDILEKDSQAPTIVFVPGTAIYALCYAEILHLLFESGYNVIGFDPRGHGQSEGTRGDFTISEIMRDTAQVISYAIENFNPKVSLMGSSQGGIVALYMAASDTRLDSVICQNFADLTSPESVSLTKHPRLFKYLKMMMSKAGELIPNAQIPIGAYIDLDKIPVTGFGNIANFIEHDPLALKTISIRALQSLGNTALQVPLAKIKVPVFVFQGDEDSIFEVNYTTQIFNQLTCKKRMLVFKGMSHSLMSENATEVLPELLLWLEKIYPKEYWGVE